MEVERLAAIYERFAPLVFGRARRIIGTDADDIVQEVFMKLLDVATPLPDAQLVPWLYTCCTNLCLDRLRHAARRHDGWQSELRAVLTTATARSADELLAQKDLCRKLLASVDERTQEIVALVHLDEMTQQEAADQLGVSRKTVVKRLGQFAEHTEKMVRRWQT